MAVFSAMPPNLSGDAPRRRFTSTCQRWGPKGRQSGYCPTHVMTTGRIICRLTGYRWITSGRTSQVKTGTHSIDYQQRRHRRRGGTAVSLVDHGSESGPAGSTSKYTHISKGWPRRIARWRMRGDSIYGASSPIPVRLSDQTSSLGT